MYVRLVTFDLSTGKESVAAELARDLVPEIRRQPGCQGVTSFGDAESGLYGLFVEWNSQEDAYAAAKLMRPKLEQHLSGNTTAPYDSHLFPVIQSA